MHTSSTTSAHGHIWRWRKMRQHPEQFNLLNLAPWSRYRKWADCIIAMSEELPESAHPSRPLSTLQLNRMGCSCVSHAAIVSSCLRYRAWRRVMRMKKDRRAELNRWRSHSTARIEFLVTTGHSIDLTCVGNEAMEQVNWKP